MVEDKWFGDSEYKWQDQDSRKTLDLIKIVQYMLNWQQEV